MELQGSSLSPKPGMGVSWTPGNTLPQFNVWPPWCWESRPAGILLHSWGRYACTDSLSVTSQHCTDHRCQTVSYCPGHTLVVLRTPSFEIFVSNPHLSILWKRV